MRHGHSRHQRNRSMFGWLMIEFLGLIVYHLGHLFGVTIADILRGRRS